MNTLEVTEEVKDGLVVKRLINGQEVDPKKEFDWSLVDSVRIIQTMPIREFKERFGNIVGSKGIS